MKTAVIYARYSSDNQTEQSIEGQLHVCEQYAKQHDILIVDTYIDRAMTGTNDNRPDFQRMIKDSNKKQWNYVLVYKLDRFSRNKYETTIHKHTLATNGIKLISAMENIPDTPEGIILESLLEGMNQYYSAELAQKVKRGMKETRLKGNFTGGLIIYGYKVKDRKVVIDEDEANVVRYIFKQYSIGTYVKDIIKTLTEKNILKNGKPFAENTIYNMLKNEKYFGICRVNNETFENIYPPIIPKEIYEKVRAKIELNKVGKRSIVETYLLRNKLKCGYCGNIISAECGTSKTGDIRRYYKCRGRKYQHSCQKSVIRKNEFEEFILNSIIDALSSSKNFNILIDNILKVQDKNNKSNPILNSLQKEKSQDESKLKNILKAIENGLINTTTNNRMIELENSITELERKIVIETSKQATLLTEQEVKEFFLQALKLEPKQLIDYLIKEIIVYEDKVEIIYNTPLKTSPTEKDLFFYIKNYHYDYHIKNTGITKTIEMQIKMRI